MNDKLVEVTIQERLSLMEAQLRTPSQLEAGLKEAGLPAFAP